MKDWAAILEAARGQESRFRLMPVKGPKKVLGSTNLAELIELNDQRQAPWKDLKLPPGLVALMLNEAERGREPLRSWVRDAGRFGMWLIIKGVVRGQKKAKVRQR